MIVCADCGHVFSEQDEYDAKRAALAADEQTEPVDEIECPECGRALDAFECMELLEGAA